MCTSVDGATPAEVERVLRDGRVVRLRPAGYDSPVARALVAEVQQEYVVRYGGPDDAVVDRADFEPPAGLFLVAEVGGEAVGCAAWRVHGGDSPGSIAARRPPTGSEHRSERQRARSGATAEAACGGERGADRGAEPAPWPPAPGVVEVKRVYVAPRARRLGLADLLMDAVEASAAAAGHRSVVLNTGDRQPEALALYARRGYGPVPGYGVYADSPGAVFLGKEIGGDPTDRGEEQSWAS